MANPAIIRFHNSMVLIKRVLGAPFDTFICYYIPHSIDLNQCAKGQKIFLISSKKRTKKGIACLDLKGNINCVWCSSIEIKLIYLWNFFQELHPYFRIRSNNCKGVLNYIRLFQGGTPILDHRVCALLLRMRIK